MNQSKILKMIKGKEPIECSQENWDNSWVSASISVVEDIIEHIESSGDHVLDIDLCSNGGYHIWTDEQAKNMQEKRKD